MMDFLNSGSLKLSRLQKINSFETFILSIIFFLVCQFLFYQWQNQINDGIVNLPWNSSIDKYVIFDKQFLYTPQIAFDVLDTWGDDGIRTYYKIQLMDVFLFCPVYRTLLIVITNYFLSSLSKSLDPKSLKSFQYFLLFPFFLTIVDYIEDAMQVLFCYFYQRSNGDVENSFVWDVIVGIASVFNFCKWLLMAIGLFELVVMLLLVIAAKVKPSKQEPADEKTK